jgi:hypothetical protein
VALVIAGLMIAALLIARYNLRAERADRRSATRLAMAVMVGYSVTWVISGDHVPDVQQEINSFTRVFSLVLFAACALWVIYVALEPYVRRFWPDGILGWTRLMSGRIRDPRVGQDALIGCVVGVGLTVLELLYNYVPPIVGYRSELPFFQPNVATLVSGWMTVSTIFDAIVSGVFNGMFLVLGYVLLRLMFRRSAFAIAAFFVVACLVQWRQVLDSAAPFWLAAIYQLVVMTVITAVVARYGLLVTVISAAAGRVLESIPITYSLSHWTATTSNLVLAFVFGLALFGFYASRAGQPLFGKLERVSTP